MCAWPSSRCVDSNPYVECSHPSSFHFPSSIIPPPHHPDGVSIIPHTITPHPLCIIPVWSATRMPQRLSFQVQNHPYPQPRSTHLRHNQSRISHQRRDLSRDCLPSRIVLIFQLLRLLLVLCKKTGFIDIYSSQTSITCTFSMSWQGVPSFSPLYAAYRMCGSLLVPEFQSYSCCWKRSFGIPSSWSGASRRISLTWLNGKSIRSRRRHLVSSAVQANPTINSVYLNASSYVDLWPSPC